MSGCKSTRIACFGSAFLCLVGCAGPKMTLDDLKKMPVPPKPAELALLDPWVGTWQTTGEMTMSGLDQKLTGRGTQTIAWENDGRTLVEHMQWEMPDMGANGKMTAICMYALEDAKEKEFTMVMTSSMGEMCMGEMKFNEKTKTWHMKSRGKDPMSGQNVQMKGIMKMPDPSTIEWTCEQYDALGFTKLMEMKGVSKRK